MVRERLVREAGCGLAVARRSGPSGGSVSTPGGGAVGGKSERARERETCVGGFGI
jgi:hypothetical protein